MPHHLVWKSKWPFDLWQFSSQSQIKVLKTQHSRFVNSMFVVMLRVTTFRLDCLLICGLFIGRFQAFQECFAHVMIITGFVLYFCKMIKDFAKNGLSLAGSFFPCIVIFSDCEMTVYSCTFSDLLRSIYSKINQQPASHSLSVCCCCSYHHCPQCGAHLKGNGSTCASSRLSGENVDKHSETKSTRDQMSSGNWPLCDVTERRHCNEMMIKNIDIHRDESNQPTLSNRLAGRSSREMFSSGRSAVPSVRTCSLVQFPPTPSLTVLQCWLGVDLPVKVTPVGKQVPTVCRQHGECFCFSFKASDWIYSREALPDDFLHKLVYDWIIK